VARAPPRAGARISRPRFSDISQSAVRLRPDRHLQHDGPSGGTDRQDRRRRRRAIQDRLGISQLLETYFQPVRAGLSYYGGERGMISQYQTTGGDHNATLGETTGTQLVSGFTSTL
jgi:hypothetical protein